MANFPGNGWLKFADHIFGGILMIIKWFQGKEFTRNWNGLLKYVNIHFRKKNFSGFWKRKGILTVGRKLQIKSIMFFLTKIGQGSNVEKGIWTMFDLETMYLKVQVGLLLMMNNFSSSFWNTAPNGCKLVNKYKAGIILFN